MKDASSSLQPAPSLNWQLLGELELTVNADSGRAVGEWLMVILSPFQLQADFVIKVVRSAQEAAARVLQSETGIRYQHTHLLLYIPADRTANGGTWGFFRIEKVGIETVNGTPRDHSIEFYLYLEKG